MPELPEVETVCTHLRQHLIGQTIRDAVLSGYRLRCAVPSDFVKRIKHCKLTTISRVGKYLLFTLNENHADPMVCHLGMSGQLIVYPHGTTALPHTHVMITLSDVCLHFIDPRRFGLMAFASTPHVKNALTRLGVDPFGSSFTGASMHKLCRGRTASIKSVLMDQTVIAGVGNIYATEALWLAGVDPRKKAMNVGLKKWNTLCCLLHRVLKNAIIHGGSTLRDYRQANGDVGRFQSQWRVYGKDNIGRICGWRGDAHNDDPALPDHVLSHDNSLDNASSLHTSANDRFHKTHDPFYHPHYCKGVITTCQIGNRVSNYCPHHQR